MCKIKEKSSINLAQFSNPYVQSSFLLTVDLSTGIISKIKRTLNRLDSRKSHTAGKRFVGGE